MKHSKLSNNSAPVTMKSVFLMAFAILTTGCGEKDSDGVNTNESESVDAESTSTIHGDKLINLNGVWCVKGSFTPFTGRFFDSFKNGEKRLEANLKNGKFHGPVERWFENGQKEQEVIFVEGTIHGASRGWFKNGQMQNSVIYKEGKLNGGVLIPYHSQGSEFWTDMLCKSAQSGVVQHSENVIRSGFILRSRIMVNLVS